MKVDRILEIIIYLINHDNVPASYLAERFHVSVRTIQRDMTSISAIGIPVYASAGKKGGYSVLPSYKMKNADIRADEQQMIIKALESLATSYSSDTLNGLIEKYNAIVEKEGGQKVFWDFGVAKENQDVQDMNSILEKAIGTKHIISFAYRNASGEQSLQEAEPLAIHYKWYAWYLFAYSEKRKEYRTFKVARMQNLKITERTSRLRHGNVEQLMRESEEAYCKTCIPIEVHFSDAHSGLMKEYFPDCPITKIGEGKSKILIHVPAKERLWKALLLSFGDKVTVIGPEEYKNELINTAAQFLSNYGL